TDVFAHGELAVDADALERAEGVVLCGEALRSGQELLVRFRCPPVSDLSSLVEFTSLIVETMSHFVTDDRSDRTVVHSWIGIRIEERRLKDCCRKRDLIHQRIVISVYGLRGHTPLCSVDRLVQTLHLTVPLELARFADILEDLARFDRERGVVAPLHRIADARIEAGQFFLSFSAGLCIHP